MAQGTIKEFDEQSHNGSLLMEDRSEIAIDATSLEGAGSPHARDRSDA